MKEQAERRARKHAKKLLKAQLMAEESKSESQHCGCYPDYLSSCRQCDGADNDTSWLEFGCERGF